ncbi:hypothetical protein PPL_03561 [Heterostelium album PN500]|uniref:Uncharacterized protein n=1 Tax=Heterostelium pallidum (strain ATCC 26659 / Pp 5 / PN500) TaxID=670386 RepID=D3B550_HETP5|nr:hypothetical protein PPL_03561 [Heterostelium album PN500]EFA83415.1 hypothetical protein PPL_03561 [Heterostelium album PN500]|eukprot:XP_020435532.1 hypothetical protein PPL_03561 [Heterostelium album PN500]
MEMSADCISAVSQQYPAVYTGMPSLCTHCSLVCCSSPRDSGSSLDFLVRSHGAEPPDRCCL